MQPNSTKTALLFPGLDALFMASKLKRWLAYEPALASLHEASRYLAAQTGQKENLAEFINAHSRLHLADFDRTLVALTALQVGIARELIKTNPWDIAQGCSHGDVARSVICESISYEHAVKILWAFAILRKECPKGYTANVRARDGTPLSETQLRWFAEHNTPVSMWSDTNATIGGATETIDQLVAESEAHGLKIKPVLPYPVHSPAMAPLLPRLQGIAKDLHFADPKRAVFSSIWLRYLKTGKEILEEGLAGSVMPVRWVETLTHLRERENVTNFINVGPSNTLTGWLFNNPKFRDVTLHDGWDLLVQEDQKID